MDLMEILKLLTGFIGGLISLYIFNKSSGKAEKKEQADCIDKIKLEVADHGLRIMTGHQLHESLAGKYEERFKHLENKVNQFENIVPEVNALKMELKMYTGKMDTLIEGIKESKADNKDTIKEIKEMIRNQGIATNGH